MVGIAERVRDWRSEGLVVSIVRLVDSRGFSSRERAGLAAFAVGRETAGAVLAGAVDDQVQKALAMAPRMRSLLSVSVTDAAATGAGLSCGGSARLLVHPATDITDEGWGALASGGPVCLVTGLRGEDVLGTEVFAATSIEEAEQRYGPGVRRLFTRGTTSTSMLESSAATSVVTSLWPVPTLVVVGGGAIATALVAAAGLLEWHAQVVDGGEQASTAMAGLTRADSVVILSHDRSVDGPALLAALASDAGYIGGLGSARTQAERAQWLREQATAGESLDRINGPAGLDIAAFTPAEIATSITAEIIAARSGAPGGPLRGRSGPIRPS